MGGIRPDEAPLDRDHRPRRGAEGRRLRGPGRPSLAALLAAVGIYLLGPDARAPVNATRREVLATVQDRPGVCIADVAGAVGISHSTASYHLEKLTTRHLVVSTEDGNKVRFFANGDAYHPDERAAIATLENPTTRKVLGLILRHEPTYRAAIAEELDVSPPTVNWHLDRLQGSALVTETPAGRRRLLRADRAHLQRILESVLGKIQGTSYDAAGLQRLLEELQLEE